MKARAAAVQDRTLTRILGKHDGFLTGVIKNNTFPLFISGRLDVKVCQKETSHEEFWRLANLVDLSIGGTGSSDDLILWLNAIRGGEAKHDMYTN